MPLIQNAYNQSMVIKAFDINVSITGLIQTVGILTNNHDNNMLPIILNSQALQTQCNEVRLEQFHFYM